MLAYREVDFYFVFYNNINRAIVSLKIFHSIRQIINMGWGRLVKAYKAS
jgi:hypothetical protein